MLVCSSLPLPKEEEEHLPTGKNNSMRNIELCMEVLHVREGASEINQKLA